MRKLNSSGNVIKIASPYSDKVSRANKMIQKKAMKIAGEIIDRELFKFKP